MGFYAVNNEIKVPARQAHYQQLNLDRRLAKCDRLFSPDPTKRNRNDQRMDADKIHAYIDSMMSKYPDDPKVAAVLIKYLKWKESQEREEMMKILEEDEDHEVLHNGFKTLSNSAKTTQPTTDSSV